MSCFTNFSTAALIAPAQHRRLIVSRALTAIGWLSAGLWFSLAERRPVLVGRQFGSFHPAQDIVQAILDALEFGIGHQVF